MGAPLRALAEDSAQELLVVDVAVESADALAGSGFDDEPVLVADVVDGFLELVEVDPPVAEQEAVFLHAMQMV